MLSPIIPLANEEAALSSQMESTEEPSLTSELVDHYENGDAVEGDFIQSWNQIERFYCNHAPHLKDFVLPFLAELRRAGYDRKFRAGQQVQMLVLSRSRRHGMRPDQPRVAFWFHLGIMDVHCDITEPRKKIVRIPITLSRVVEDELTKLANQPVD